MANENFKPGQHIAEGNAWEIQTRRSALEHGSRGDLPIFYRYVVLETIFDPTIIDPNKISYFEHSLQVSNIHLASVLPRNTIVAKRVMTPGTSASAPPMFLFPFFPPAISLPCQPGEHVWVMFENPTGTVNDLGYWMCRIVEPGFVEDANHTHAARGVDPSFAPGIKDQAEGTDDPVYDFRNGRADTRDGTRYTLAETAMLPGKEDVYENLMSTTDGGKLSVLEPVPRYRKRPGDVAFEGTNNTLIVLGRDRNGKAAKYKIDEATQASVVDSLPDDDEKGVGSGAIDVVVGRGQTEITLGKEVESQTISGHPTGNKELGKSTKELVEGEGDPDFKNDRARIHVSQKTKIDKNFAIDKVVEAHTSKKKVSDDEGSGAIVIKTDKIRLVARQDLVILITASDEKDEKGNVKDADADPDKCASITIRTNGDIIFTPAKAGIVKLGGDDADKAVLCFKEGAANADGTVAAPPMMSTMGGFLGLGGAHGVWASKIMVK